MNKKAVSIAMAAALLVMSGASACAVKVGTATTSVYVRSMEDGEIVGSIHKGDKVIITGNAKNGYKKVKIGDKTYKVYGEYMEITEENEDDVKTVKKPGKSKTLKDAKKKSVKKKKKAKLKGSDFEGVYFW